MSPLNMNATCYCGHRLAQHSKTVGCGHCDCTGFTEKLTYKCEVCSELISILEAPNAEITRLSFADNGRNYAHTKCMSKRKKSPLSKPSSSLKMKSTQLTSEAVSEFLESAVFNGMLMLTEKEVTTLICQLAEHNVYDPAGDIDTDLVPVGTDYHKVLTRLKDFLDNIVK